MNIIPYLAWEPAYSVTVEHIDEQHRKLFDIANDLIDEVQMGSNRLLPIIRDLVHYVSVHFHDENIVMMKSGYPDFDKHNQEHRQFTEKVEEFIESYKQGDAELGMKMIIYMKEWIFNHTTRLDMEYAAHLRDNPGALRRDG